MQTISVGQLKGKIKFSDNFNDEDEDINRLFYDIHINQ